MVGQARHQAAHVFAKSPVRAGKGANSGMMRDLKDDAEPVAKSEVSIKHRKHLAQRTVVRATEGEPKWYWNMVAY
ncbi:hypothetical protein IAQ61_003963 [Plenodomus lingam]|uniref:uncharacterized protein n=1 Tax=Leptosphaeria maculans TaxID=5022 RepID=UPI0033198E81|nr:hypothetical protein IAQ61_003963 [Plenodomus lingam]